MLTPISVALEAETARARWAQTPGQEEPLTEISAHAE